MTKKTKEKSKSKEKSKPRTVKSKKKVTMEAALEGQCPVCGACMEAVIRISDGNLEGQK